MLKSVKETLIIVIVLAGSVSLSLSEPRGAFPPHVDGKGIISLPSAFRSTWVHLGTWVVTSTSAAGAGYEQTSPGVGFHEVYTQTASLQEYRKAGTWPDGATLVMEVRPIQWDDLPTGHVMAQGEAMKWLVMVRDGKGRFTGHPNWGKGWGWALFKPQDPTKNLSKDFKTDCLGCHDAAGDTALVFVEGLAVIRK